MMVFSWVFDLLRNMWSTGTEEEPERHEEEPEILSGCPDCDQQERKYKQSVTILKMNHSHQINEMNSALKKKEDELESVRNSLKNTGTFNKKKLQEDCHHKETHRVSSCWQCDQQEHKFHQRLVSMEMAHTQEIPKLRSDLKQKEDELESVRNSLKKMEAFYQKKLEEQSRSHRAALKQQDEDLRSFKDRVASDVSASIKTGNTVSLNSPVSSSRLLEMYREFKLLQWPKVKDQLRSQKMNPQVTRNLIQKTFSIAKEQMDSNKKQIEHVFDLIKSNSGLTPQKVEEYRKLAILNLQMSVYHQKSLIQPPLCDLEMQYSAEVMATLGPLFSQCYWMGCLLALNNPPLHLDWDSCFPGMDPWAFFPETLS
ncbi:uncharacterized protein KZ484_000904 isoform 2-T3 [Pholidichthys leucotaenia]